MKFTKGDIICRKEAVYPHGALAVVGKNKEGHLVAHSKGGGFDIIIPEESVGLFRKVTEEEMQVALYAPGRFRIADCEKAFAGWSKGEKWNGWEKPYFEMDACREILAWLGDDRARFDVDLNAFITVSQDGEEEVWENEIIGISDGTCINAFGLGAGAWMWEVAI
jgi:hypothetical protein